MPWAAGPVAEATIGKQARAPARTRMDGRRKWKLIDGSPEGWNGPRSSRRVKPPAAGAGSMIQWFSGRRGPRPGPPHCADHGRCESPQVGPNTDSGIRDDRPSRSLPGAAARNRSPHGVELDHAGFVLVGAVDDHGSVSVEPVVVHGARRRRKPGSGDLDRLLPAGDGRGEQRQRAVVRRTDLASLGGEDHGARVAADLERAHAAARDERPAEPQRRARAADPGAEQLDDPGAPLAVHDVLAVRADAEVEDVAARGERPAEPDRLPAAVRSHAEELELSIDERVGAEDDALAVARDAEARGHFSIRAQLREQANRRRAAIDGRAVERVHVAPVRAPAEDHDVDRVGSELEVQDSLVRRAEPARRRAAIGRGDEELAEPGALLEDDLAPVAGELEAWIDCLHDER